MKTRILEVRNARAGDFRETQSIDHNRVPVGDFDPFTDLHKKVRGTMAESGTHDLLEAFIATPDADNLLRDGIRYIAFNTYQTLPQSFATFTRVETSNKPQEEYLRDAVVGTLPRVPSGTEAPLLTSSFDSAVTVKNFRYAGIAEVTGDDIRFDRLGKIRQIAAELGHAARMTEENEVYTAITDASNYKRSATNGDNDVPDVGNGENTQALTFSGANFEAACSIISTAKDRRSGSYLGLMPRTIIIGPRMEVPVKQLLVSGDLARVGGGTATDNETRGTGTVNHYRGMIERIVISPWFSNSYAWALVDDSVLGFILQQVMPFNVYQEAQDATSEAWLVRDVIRHLVQGYFGVGFVSDAPWFYSSSSTAPTIS